MMALFIFCRGIFYIAEKLAILNIVLIPEAQRITWDDLKEPC